MDARADILNKMTTKKRGAEDNNSENKKKQAAQINNNASKEEEEESKDFRKIKLEANANPVRCAVQSCNVLMQQVAFAFQSSKKYGATEKSKGKPKFLFACCPEHVKLYKDSECHECRSYHPPSLKGRFLGDGTWYCSLDCNITALTRARKKKQALERNRAIKEREERQKKQQAELANMLESVEIKSEPVASGMICNF